MYAAIAATHNSDKELMPNGKPRTTSLIIPDININKYNLLINNY